MKRLLQVRITKWYFKLLYILGVYLFFLLVELAIGVLRVPPIVFSVIYPPLLLAVFLLGARLFRVAEEELQPARPWWRMTGRPALGWVLGVYFAAATLLFVVSLIAYAGGAENVVAVVRTSPVRVTGTSVVTAILTFLYVNASVRIARMRRLHPAREELDPGEPEPRVSEPAASD
jgi:hypothetical protein